ncbi:MAG: transposase [Oscillospiraceae bacterium]|nr:transposase [Oscillospiraceae bacterium]
MLQTYIWQEYLDSIELRKTAVGKNIYVRRKETIKRIFADAKEKHGMCDTHHRGLARVNTWVRPKFAAMNLKKPAVWSWKTPFFFPLCFFLPICPQNSRPRLLRTGVL